MEHILHTAVKSKQVSCARSAGVLQEMRDLESGAWRGSEIYRGAGEESKARESVC